MASRQQLQNYMTIGSGLAPSHIVMPPGLARSTPSLALLSNMQMIAGRAILITSVK